MTPGIAKHLQTHRQATHRMGCSCALFVFDETWRFQSQSTAFGLLRGYLAAAKLRFFPEWITIIPRKSHICSLKLSFFLFQKLKMNSVTNTGLTVAMGITIETMRLMSRWSFKSLVVNLLCWPFSMPQPWARPPSGIIERA